MVKQLSHPLVSGLLLFLTLEALVVVGAYAAPHQTEGLWWEGPLSLTVLLCSIVLTLRRWRGRPRWQALLIVAVATPVALCLVPIRPWPASETRIEVAKSQRTLTLWRGERLLKSYPIGLGGAPEGDKEQVGDSRTPLGRFVICSKAPSTFHRWLGLNYPTLEDATRGRLEARISWIEYAYIRFENLNARVPYGGSALGGAVGIHGGGSSKDWTLGCVALSNQDVEELYRQCEVGTEVLIIP